MVRLCFAELDDIQPGDRVFDISLQGKTVLENFDVIGETGSRRRSLTKTFPDMTIDRKLRIGMKSRGKLPPLLSGFEAKRKAD